MSSRISVSLNKMTKTLMNFRSSLNTFTMSSTCLDKSSVVKTLKRKSPIFLQDVICSKARCVNDGELWGKFCRSFKKKLFNKYFHLIILNIIVHKTCRYSHHWSWWPCEVAKPWSRVNTSGLRHRPIWAHLSFQDQGSTVCCWKKAPWSSREETPLPGNCEPVPPEHLPGLTCLFK